MRPGGSHPIAPPLSHSTCVIACMAGYRICVLDSEGRIRAEDWVEADSDEEAVLKARELRPDGRQCEIWHKASFVGRVTFAGRFEGGEPEAS